jgi:hypothetical protein
MVAYCALRYLCRLETFPSHPREQTVVTAVTVVVAMTMATGNSARKQLPYFDLPKHVRKVLYNNFIHNFEHLHSIHVRLTAALPPESIPNGVGLYILSSRYLLDP